jgi:transcriptional regulator with XRE-family HTH domain
MGKRSFSEGHGGSALPPERHPAHDQAGGADWREWMRELGRRQRQLREFAGLSQEQLARLAGVSQGSVSRLEIGRGLATPLLIVLKINAALVRELQRIDPAILSPELREALELQSALCPTRGALAFQEVPLAEGPELEELVRLYRASPERHRSGLVSVLRAMVAGLTLTQ